MEKRAIESSENFQNLEINPQNCPHCINYMTEFKLDAADDFACEAKDPLKILLKNLTSFAEFVVELGLALASGACTLFLSVLWAVHCLHVSLAKDWHEHQMELTERDGLMMSERNYHVERHTELLKARADLLKLIDRARYELTLSGEFQEREYKNLQEAAAIIEQELSDCEATLRLHKMA